MKANVNVFCAGMVLVFFGKGNGGLIVRKKNCCVEFGAEELKND